MRDKVRPNDASLPYKRVKPINIKKGKQNGII